MVDKFVECWQPIQTVPRGKRVLTFSEEAGVYIFTFRKGVPLDGDEFNPTWWRDIPLPPSEWDEWLHE